VGDAIEHTTNLNNCAGTALMAHRYCVILYVLLVLPVLTTHSPRTAYAAYVYYVYYVY
jgi:hypothetical protein